MKFVPWMMALALVGCSEGRDDTYPINDAAADLGAEAAAPTDTPTPPTDVAADAVTATDAVASGQLVINEISAVGSEWIELYNAGRAPIDLSEVQVTDTESDGGPRLSRAMRFPRGTMLSPEQYVLVLADQSDAGAGPQTACLDGGPTTCFHAGWSLSASRGERVYVLSSSGSVTASELFPMEATPEGRSWARLPNGTGSFALARPTPGAANLAP